MTDPDSVRLLHFAGGLRCDLLEQTLFFLIFVLFLEVIKTRKLPFFPLFAEISFFPTYMITYDPEA